MVVYAIVFVNELYGWDKTTIQMWDLNGPTDKKPVKTLPSNRENKQHLNEDLRVIKFSRERERLFRLREKTNKHEQLVQLRSV